MLQTERVAAFVFFCCGLWALQVHFSKGAGRCIRNSISLHPYSLQAPWNGCQWILWVPDRVGKKPVAAPKVCIFISMGHYSASVLRMLQKFAYLWAWDTTLPVYENCSQNVLIFVTFCEIWSSVWVLWIWLWVNNSIVQQGKFWMSFFFMRKIILIQPRSQLS